MTLAVGTRVGPYEVLEWIDSGGMGDIYRARDARLQRHVALKVLPERFASEPGRLARFEREARAAGQLDHENILTVHDVGRHGHLPYLVTELLSGTSLRERLRRGPLLASEAIEYARQVANGLAAAHASGVVHRDIKPENLFVTSTHRVKILDFGVAKLADAEEDTSRAAVTSTMPGASVGTNGYMSPEQARGEPTDARADIFSLGAVLYEMLAGRAPFIRETGADTLAAILKDEAAPLTHVSMPAPLAAIIMRCLEKSRDARFQSARDLSFALAQCGTGAGTVTARARPSRRALLVIAAAAVTVAGVIGLMSRWSDQRSFQARFTDARFTRLTDWPGTEGQGVISPDGRFVAFLSDRDRPFDIWLGRIGTGEFRNLTAGVAPLRPPGPVLKLLSFAGDGASLWSGAGTRSMLVPVDGGTPRPFLGPRSAGAAWSPDGRRLAYFENGSGDPLFVSGASGADPLLVFSGGDPQLHTHNPMWSPDGAWVYFLHGPSVGASFAMDIWRVRPSGDAAEQLTHLAGALNFLTWVDHRTVLFVVRERERPGSTLWVLDVETRQAARLLSGVDEYRSLSASRDGRRLVATIARPVSTLARVRIAGGRVADPRDVRPVAAALEARGPRYAGTVLFFLSRRGAGDDLWQVKDGDATAAWHASDDPIQGPIAVSPDERRVALIVRRDTQARLAVLSLDGNRLQTLSAAIVPGGSSDWSPDGRWIVTSGTVAGGEGVFKVPVAGGAPVRLAPGSGDNPVWSPDGGLILYTGPILTGGVSRILGVTPDGVAVDLPEVYARPGGLRFLRDGTGVIYQSAVLDFHQLDLASRTTRQLTDLGFSSPMMSGRAFDVSPDGTEIVFERSSDNADIVLIDLP